MKNIFLTIFFSLFITTISIAQEEPASVLLKWAPAGLFAGKLTIGGEYNFSPKNSVVLNIGIPVKANHQIDYDEHTSDFSSKAFSVLLGYRRYLGRREMTGLYIEPYVKYLKHEASGILEGALEGERARFLTSTTYSGYGLGAQLGAQFLIGNRFVIDFFFLGPEANISRFSTSATDIESNIPWTFVQAQEAEEDIKDLISEIPIIGNKTEITVNQQQKRVDTKYEGFMPGFRFGLSFGVRL